MTPPSASHPSARDRQREETREQILGAVARQLEAGGQMEELSFSEIARDAGVGELLRALCTTLGEMLGHDGLDTLLRHMLDQRLDLGLGVALEAVHADDDGQAVVCANVRHMPVEIGAALDQGLDVLLVDVGKLDATRILERANRRDEHDG